MNRYTEPHAAVLPDLSNALDEGIRSAGIAGILSRDEYYGFLDALVTWVPTDRDLAPKILNFYSQNRVHIASHFSRDGFSSYPSVS